MKKGNIKKSIRHKTLEEALFSFRHSMTSALVHEAKERGCSLSHFEAIKHVAEYGNPSMKDIALQLHITPPSASALIDALVAKGLVIRSHTAEDRRTIRVVLAPKGHRFLSSIYKQKDSVFNTMLSKLKTEDKNELARILTKCISI